jgi:iron complex outermembrane recepter protein
MNSRILVVLALMLSVPLTALAQSGTISGKVTDSTGEALPGANVVVRGLSIGASADIDGNYTIPSVPVGSHIVEASFLGFTGETHGVTVVAGETAIANFELESDAVALDAVVVTGTRSRGRTAMQSATPIDKLETAALERQNNGDMTETLKNLVPSFAATPLTGDGAAFVRPTSLRGLPPDDVLILMNSKRRHRSALISHFGAAMNVGAHASDIGMIPAISLKSVEVLRDGAAAQYGSDAIAGVLNFITKDSNRGVEVQTQVGQWYEGETDLKLAANVGLPLTANGFLNLSAEYTDNPELSRGVQHAAAAAATARGIPNVKDPAMNWGRPESSGLRTVWNAGIDLNSTTSVYSFGNYADTYGNYSFFYRAPGKSGALEQLPANPNDPSEGNFCWCDTFPAGFTPRFEGDQTDLSGIVGLKGILENGVGYDVSGSYGFNRINYTLLGSLNASWGPESQFDFKPGDLKQEDVNLNLDLTYPVNDQVNLAGGLEWRQETYTMFVGDKQSWLAGPWAKVQTLIDPNTGENYAAPGVSSNGFTGTAPDIAGEFDGSNWAAYVEAEFDVNEDLLIQLAARHEDYREFGTTNDGKIAVRYNVSDNLTFRGGVSTGFRAPTPGQANVTTITTSFDGVTGQQVQEGTVRPTNPLAVALGGKALVPEDALNISLGFAARTSRVSFTADVYRIQVDGRILKSRSLSVTGDPNFSELAFYTNALDTDTKGIDVVAFLTGDANTDLSVAYNYNETEVTGQTQVNGVNPVSDGTVFNIENNLPNHRVSATAVRRMDKFSAMLRANVYGGTVDERGTREEVASTVLLDLEVTYNVNPNFTIIAGANNLLNTFPTKIDTRLSQGMPYPRRTPIGYNGGVGFVRLRYKM